MNRVPHRNRLFLKLLAGILALSFAIPIVFNQILDIDIWWHLQLGRSALRHLGLPDLHEFYFTRIIEAPSVYRYSLLGDVLLYLVHSVGGDIGLQFFAAGMLLLAGWTLQGMGRLHGGFLLLACMVFIGTTYQLQIIRNAIFSLPLICLLLRFWWEARLQGRQRAWWLIAPLLTLWSFLHGSYLLGFGIFALIFCGDLIDQVRVGKLSIMPFRDYATQLIASAFGIALFNQLTFQLVYQLLKSKLAVTLFATGLLFLLGLAVLYLKGYRPTALQQKKAFPFLFGGLIAALIGGGWFQFRKFFGTDLTMTGIDLSESGTVIALESPGFWGRLKFGFNNLFWKTADAEYFSSDFLSPFDSLPEIYVWLTFALGLFTVIVFVYTRFTTFAYLLPFTATMILALGYKRTLGYWAIVCLFCLFRALETKPLALPHLHKMAWSASVLLWAFFWGGFGLGLWDAGLRNFHHLGFGRAPIFSSAAAQDLLEHHPEAKTFTTVANGGFVLSRWYPNKRIFIDGFFAPHRGGQLKIYQAILFGGDPDALVSQLGLKTAIINLHDIKWFNMFNRAPSWYPEAVDEGMVVFVYQPYFKAEVPQIRLHNDLARMAKLPANYLRMVANRMFQLQTGYLLKGRIQAARALTADNADFFAGLPAYADDRVREESARNLSMAQDRFGESDNLWLRNEFLYQDAMTRGDQADVRKFGGLIFDEYPDRFELALVLIGAALNAQNLSETRRYLLALDRAKGEDPDFFKRQQSQIAEMRYRGARLMRDNQHWEEALGQLEKARELAPARFNDDVLFNEGLTYYEGLMNGQFPLRAYQMLVKLELHFPENPFVQHLLAATIRDHHQILKLPMTSALKYASRALELAKDEEEAPIEAFRENMAQILDKLGKPEEAARYRIPDKPKG